MRYKIVISETDTKNAADLRLSDATVIYHTHDAADRRVTVHDIAQRLAASLGCYVISVEEFAASRPRTLPQPDPECSEAPVTALQPRRI